LKFGDLANSHLYFGNLANSQTVLQIKIRTTRPEQTRQARLGRPYNNSQRREGELQRHLGLAVAAQIEFESKN
jgi:hypothetical protein